MATILIRGSGDVASATAHLLFQGHHEVVLNETLYPSATRRMMAFTDAVFDDSAWLDNVEARHINLEQLSSALQSHTFIPILTCDFFLLQKFMLPYALVDARMRKHIKPEDQTQLAPLTIGLGPNFSAGENVHLAIETGRGDTLGKVITHGSTRPLEGEPIEMDGHARDRYIYAPQTGIFHTTSQIGQFVFQGQILAYLDEQPLYAPLSGHLRGLTHDGVPVGIHTKLIEIDPRGANIQINGIPPRPARIAQGVLEALTMSNHD